MTKLHILTAPDPRLKRKSQPVSAFDARLHRLIDDMLETMYAAPGIGLAAPQVGILERLLVLDVAARDAPADPRVFINPEIVWASEDDATYEEGCLSVPEHYSDVARPASVRVKHFDRDGIEREVEATGLLATCLQHEMDHLDGILFIDHLSQLKRNMILRKLTKTKRQGGI